MTILTSVFESWLLGWAIGTLVGSVLGLLIVAFLLAPLFDEKKPEPFTPHERKPGDLF